MFICFLLLQNKLQQALMVSNTTYFFHSPESLEAHIGCTGFSTLHLSKLAWTFEDTRENLLPSAHSSFWENQFFVATKLRFPVLIKSLMRMTEFLIFLSWLQSWHQTVMMRPGLVERPVTLATQEAKVGNDKFKAWLSYLVSSRLSWTF